MWNNYASDAHVRTQVFIGEINDRQREVYNVVLEANARYRRRKPGNKMSDVDKVARDYITVALWRVLHTQNWYQSDLRITRLVTYLS